MATNQEYFQSIYVDINEIGSHSIWKGAATYCCAGVHPGSPIFSVCLRAGWTIGRAKERYLKYENAGKNNIFQKNNIYINIKCLTYYNI